MAPRPSGSPAGAAAVARTILDPSSAATTPSSSSFSSARESHGTKSVPRSLRSGQAWLPAREACAAMGAWHPPPRQRSIARSARTASCVRGSSSGMTACSILSSPSRVSMASAPWPTAGHISLTLKYCVTRSLSPRRSSPAAASTSASYSPRSSFRRRVSTLPRTGTASRSRRKARSCDCRRRLPVPTRDPDGSAESGLAPHDIKTSRGSARLGTAATPSPGGCSVGRSFRLWTARSISFAASASSISLMKSPLVPDWVRDSFGSLSPAVLMTLISTSCPWAASWSRTQPACQRASLLPRVPIIILMEPDLGFRIQDSGFRIQDSGSQTSSQPGQHAANFCGTLDNRSVLCAEITKTVCYLDLGFEFRERSIGDG